MKKLLSALLAVILAVGFWAYVMTVENPEGTNTYYNVPVVLKGINQLEERQLMIVDGENPTITLELRGNRSDLKSLKSSDFIVTADLSAVDEAGEQYLFYDVDFPGSIPQNSLQILSQQPTRVMVTLANKESKNIPVQVKYSGAVPEDYFTDKDNPVLSHTEINVKGPDTVIDQIAYAQIDVDLTDRVQSLSESYRYTLCSADGEPVDAKDVTTNTEFVDLELKIQRKKEIKLTVEVVDGGGATEKTSSIAVEPQTIWVAGSDAALSKLEELTVGTINLGEFSAATTEVMDIVLPEGVENLSNVEKASVKISFPALRIREFTVTSIRAINVPEGLAADILTTQIKVSIRGPRELINRLTLQDLTATVDMTGQEQGTFSAKVTITLPDEFASCGEVGSNSVSVTLGPEDKQPE